MTGTELSAALTEKLKTLLPDCAVRPAFTGTLSRLPQRAAVTVGVLSEENAEGVFETEIGVKLYARNKDDHVRIFDAVCAAVADLPCVMRSVKRSETEYIPSLGCLMTLCTVKAATSAGKSTRVAVYVNGKCYAADGVEVLREAEVQRYYAAGEEKPYAAVSGRQVYRITLHGFSGGGEMLEKDDFTLETGGLKYLHCAWKTVKNGKLVLEAGQCEKST